MIRQVNGSYMEAFPEYTHVSDLVAFFMHCPEDLRPSLNKAYFFIEEGGHLPDEPLTRGNSSIETRPLGTEDRLERASKSRTAAFYRLFV